jgi:hypothetical protein
MYGWRFWKPVEKYFLKQKCREKNALSILFSLRITMSFLVPASLPDLMSLILEEGTSGCQNLWRDTGFQCTMARGTFRAWLPFWFFDVLWLRNNLESNGSSLYKCSISYSTLKRSFAPRILTATSEGNITLCFIPSIPLTCSKKFHSLFSQSFACSGEDQHADCIQLRCWDRARRQVPEMALARSAIGTSSRSLW